MTTAETTLIDDMAQAAHGLLRFLGTVEPPKDAAPYDQHLAYETRKADAEERLAATVARYEEAEAA